VKATPLILSSLLYIFSAGAFAHDIAGDLPHGTSEQLRYEQDDIRDAHRAIRHSHRAIALEKHNLAYDKRVARVEALEAMEVRRRQDELIARGDYRGARKLEKVRQHEANQAEIARRHVNHDRNVIAIKHRDIEHHRNVIAIKRRELGHDRNVIYRQG
jgi:hypothetical protein